MWKQNTKMWQSYSNYYPSRNSYQLQLNEQTDIIRNSNEKTRPIDTKNTHESNFSVAKQNKVKFIYLYNCLIENNILIYDWNKSDNITEQSSFYSIIYLSYRHTICLTMIEIN